MYPHQQQQGYSDQQQQQQQGYYQNGYPPQQQQAGYPPQQPGYPPMNPSGYPPQGQPYPGYPPVGQQQPMAAQPPSQPGISYQGYVPGLSGWNDLPKNNNQQAVAVDTDVILKGIDNPAGRIVASMEENLKVVSSTAPPAQRRMVEDTEKRLEFLYERLSSQSLDRPILAKLFLLNKLDMDFITAHNIVKDFMSTIYDAEGKWVMGVKRLVELYQKAKGM